VQASPRQLHVALIVAAVLASASIVGLVSGAGVTAFVLCWSAALVVGVGLVAALGRQSADRERLTELTDLATHRADQVAVLSHEIRTPLAVIQGAGELLAEQQAGPLTAQQAVFVGRIVDNAARMHTLSEQLLTRARLEAGLFTVDRSVVDLRALFRRVIDDLCQVTDASIVLDAPGAPVQAYIDPELIRQVLVNLVHNAAHLGTPDNRIEVRILPIDDEVSVSVSDGGTGMTTEQRDRLFGRFSSGRSLGNGTGIGLFISQQFVQMHGGRIFVDTISGKGTTMMFTLPLAPSGSSGAGRAAPRRAPRGVRR